LRFCRVLKAASGYRCVLTCLHCDCFGEAEAVIPAVAAIIAVVANVVYFVVADGLTK